MSGSSIPLTFSGVGAISTPAPEWRLIEERTPYACEISLGALRMTVYRDYGRPEGWYASAPPFFERRRLSAAEIGAARDEALAAVGMSLDAAAEALCNYAIHQAARELCPGCDP